MDTDINLLVPNGCDSAVSIISRVLSEDGGVYLFRCEIDSINAMLDSQESINLIMIGHEIGKEALFDILAKTKNSDEFRHIPVIYIAKPFCKGVDELLVAGVDDVIFEGSGEVEIKKRLSNYAKTKEISSLLKNINDALDKKVKERTKALELALGLAKKSEYEISFRLGKASEFRDIETGMHIKRVSYYCSKLGELIGLGKEEVELLLYAAPLHDVGKVGIPDSVLLKPTKLNEHEFEVMKEHALIGARILEQGEGYPVLQAGKIIALEHHEKFDGTGYPFGKRWEQIHVYGRICAIADVFDALTSARIYKPQMPVDRALEIIEKGKEVHFDPTLVDIFISKIPDFIAIKDSFPDELQSAEAYIDIHGLDIYESIVGRR